MVRIGYGRIRSGKDRKVLGKGVCWFGSGRESALAGVECVERGRTVSEEGWERVRVGQGKVG